MHCTQEFWFNASGPKATQRRKDRTNNPSWVQAIVDQRSPRDSTLLGLKMSNVPLAIMRSMIMSKMRVTMSPSLAVAIGRDGVQKPFHAEISLIFAEQKFS